MKIKKMISLLLALSLLLSVSACTGGKDKQTSNGEKENGEKTKVVWWSMHRHEAEYMENLVKKYNEENTDNIEIEYIVQTTNFLQALELATQSNEAPDIFTPDQELKYYVDRKMVEPLDEYISPELKSMLGEKNFAEGINMVDGKIYSLPNFGSVFRLIYNKDLLEAAGVTEEPKTMADVVAAAKLVTKRFKDEGKYGFAINLKNPWGGFFRSLDPVAQKSGASEYDYINGRYDFSSYKPVVEAFKELVDNGSMFPGYESLDMDPLRAQFAQGNIAMYLSANWEVGVYSTQFETDINWAAAPVPYVGNEPGGAVAIRGGYWQAIHANSPNKEAAWKVLEYFHSKDVLVGYNERALGLSIIPEVIEASKPSEMYGAEYFTLSEYDAFWPAKPNTKGLSIEGKTYWEEFLAVIMGQEDIDSAIEVLNKRYNDALDKAIDQGKEKRYILEGFNSKDLINK